MKLSFTCHFDKMFFDLTDGKILQKIADLWDLATTKNNGYVTVTMELPKRPRSTGEKSQNHHLNGHVQAICKETGNDFDDVKKYIKCQAISRGYPILIDDSGKSKIDMFGNTQGISESDASVEECAILIETAHQLAAELNIKLEE